MNKSLLTLSAALCAGLMATAGTPEIFNGEFANAVSANGAWGVSATYSMVSVINTKTGEVTPLEIEGASVTTGGCVADNGTLVFSTWDAPYLLINGEPVLLDPESALDWQAVYPHSITPDASRVVGAFTPTERRGEMYNFPAIWDIDAEGKVIKATELPCPTVDFTGRPPQRCDALHVSNDGKIIVGNLVDYSGIFPQPIVYVQGEDGEWSYSLPANHLLNPDNLEFPEWPEDMPNPPSPEEYMTESEKAAYEAAVEEYYQTWENYPEPTDYLSGEGLANYTAALEAWKQLQQEHKVAVNAFFDVFKLLYDSATMFITNNEQISPDGKSIACGALIQQADYSEKYYTMIFDLENGDITKTSPEMGVFPTTLMNGGIALGTNLAADSGQPQVCYIKLPENEEYIKLYDYYTTENPELAAWLYENFYKKFEFEIMWSGQVLSFDDVFTGQVWMSSDMSTVFGGVNCGLWDTEYEYEEGLCSYLVTDATSGVSKVSVGGKDIKVSAARGGVINIAGDASFVTVYDVTGREVFGAPAAASVATGLSNGAYIVKVDSANGSKTVKVAF